MSDDIIEWWASEWGSHSKGFFGNRKRGGWGFRPHCLGELDSISPNTILTRHLMKSTTFHWARTALVDILEDDRVSLMWEKEDKPRKACPSDPLWRPHIEYLARNDVGVIALGRSELPIQHWATYFAVEKPGTFTCKLCKAPCDSKLCSACSLESATCKSRAIFNAKMWNEACKKGAHSNLIRPDVALNLMGDHPWGEPGVGFFTNSFDVKNFFYQVAISRELSRHLGIACGGLIGSCVKLPMGWHRSVITACCITAAIILSDVPKRLHTQHISNGDSPPAFITILDAGGEIRGWVFHYVDNIFVVCDDRNLFEEWVNHIRKRLKRFQVLLKYDRVDNTFLGIEFTTKEGRLWYHHSNVRKWSESDIKSDSSRRDAAHAAGVILWDRSVADIPWMKVSPTVEALSIVGREASTRKLWDSFHGLPERIVVEINSNLRRIREDHWYSRTKISRERAFACSDASMEKLAFVIMGTSTSNCTSSFAYVTVDDHIYLLELRAARMAIEFAAVQLPGRELWLAIDNKAVFHAMRRRFSLEPRAAAEFILIEEAFQGGNLSVIPVLIRGTDNLADNKTRGKRLSERRFRRTWEVLRAATEGRRPDENTEEVSEGEGDSDDEGPQGDFLEDSEDDKY